MATRSKRPSHWFLADRTNSRAIGYSVASVAVVVCDVKYCG